jgi:hypothetical protein
MIGAFPKTCGGNEARRPFGSARDHHVIPAYRFLQGRIGRKTPRRNAQKLSRREVYLHCFSAVFIVDREPEAIVRFSSSRPSWILRATDGFPPWRFVERAVKVPPPGSTRDTWRPLSGVGATASSPRGRFVDGGKVASSLPIQCFTAIDAGRRRSSLVTSAILTVGEGRDVHDPAPGLRVRRAAWIGS